MNKLILIDGYGFVFRAFHSLPPLKRPGDGVPIGAAYGFANMLYKLISNHATDHIAVVLDSGSKTFRHDVYKDYKANRPEPPQDLILQFPIIRDVIKAFNIISIEKDGYEADDLIASYAKHAKEEGMEVTIVSSDKDLMQLLAHGIKMYDSMKDKDITDVEVLAKFGVAPDKVRDVLALIGDSSDNIPGVPSIGPKTASELINAYGDLEGVYANLDGIKQEKRRQALVENKDKALLSYELVGLRFDAPMDYSIDQLKVKELKTESLKEFLDEQGFRALSNKIYGTSNTVSNTLTFKVIKPLDIIQHIPQIYKAGVLYILPTDNDLFISFGGSNFSVQLQKTTVQASLFAEEEKETQLSSVMSALNEVLESNAVTKVTIGSKWLYKLNHKVQAVEDIAIMAYANETGRNGCSLQDLIDDYAGSYTSHDSHAVSLIYNNVRDKLIANKHIRLYEHIDKKLTKVISEMEEVGVKLDTKYLLSLSTDFGAKLKTLEQKVYAAAGKEFNIGSPKQLGEILFTDMKLPSPKKSKTGTYSTSASILETLLDQGHEIAGLVLEWRQYAKLISTYTDALPKSVNPKTGRVHSNFILTNTATGRLSSTEPNLQNIPIRSEEGQRIRAAFVAKEGHKIISADYSQIELRLLAHYANIDSLKHAFLHNQDIHALTASQIFGVPLEAVDSNLRRQAKSINFGIIYGMSAFGLAKRLDISQEDAKRYITQYFTQYPGIRQYMDSTIEYAKTHGYVMTVYNRKCLIKGINDKNHAMRSFAERAAINAPLQSSAADIIKKAMINLPDHIRKYLILQIHDELLFEVPENIVSEISSEIKKVMESVVQISVPLTVDIGHGNTWADAH